ncbi:MAG: hypothetical protein CBC42_01540 [Betaproteobacteria bacterium TMED82]|nr:MAG: hypothetical protein CBC42_01540 [Betaproteobacteria bacterium TMED82]|tara:strand:- start:41977 stop:43233 length:1257 start_codon:yes stop_codon:yes gene_type:complete
MEYQIKVQSLFGIIFFLGFAWLLSENKSKVKYKSVFFLIFLQLGLASVLLALPLLEPLFYIINFLIQKIQLASDQGVGFVFGYLAGDNLPFEVKEGGQTYILAFKALPLILIFSVISSILFHFGIPQFVISILSNLILKISKIDAAAALGAASNLFVGMVEAPLLVRPYLATISRSGLFVLMTTGMSTIAGTVFLLYVSILDSVIQNIVQHLVISSFLSVFSGVLVATIIVPPNSRLKDTNYNLNIKGYSGLMDAITSGISSGLQILLTVTATLVVFLALVTLINSFLELIPFTNEKPMSLELILGILMAPLMWLTGMSWDEAIVAGGLMGLKTILNEFVAFLALSNLPDTALTERAKILCIYALCGFANLGSLGILVGGLTTLLPNRRNEVLQMGVKSLIAGTLATLITASIIGLII